MSVELQAASRQRAASGRRRRRRRRLLTLAGLGVVGAAAAASTFALTRGVSSAAPDAPAPTSRPASASPRTAAAAPGIPVHASLPGALLIADRGNNRILLVNPAHTVLWRFPRKQDLAKGIRLRFNDDTFVGRQGTVIVANEEEAHTIVQIDIKTHRRIHLYGVPGVRGSSAGLLNTPDDAYPLPDGSIVVADAYNCRVIWVRSHRIIRQIGRTGVCRHDPPRTLGAVNGDTPLIGGGVLVSEIPGHWVDEFRADGSLRWSAQVPVRYPSDPQPLTGGRVLLADYSNPGQVVIVDHAGRALWRYAPRAGVGRLDHPSLALMLPGALIAVNDDFRQRVIVIDMRTRRIVWQYGHTDVAGSGAGYLNTPDGMDFVPLSAAGAPLWAAVRHPAQPSGTTPGRRIAATVAAGARSLPAAASAAPTPGSIRRIGSLPSPAARVAAVALPGGRVMVVGGLVGNRSSRQVLAGAPRRLRSIGVLPGGNHDAAAVLLAGAVTLYGGGNEAGSTDAVVRIDPATGATRVTGHLPELLSDLGATRIGGSVYLAGGYTGTRFASAIARVDARGGTTTVARLPTGLRYAGVAALDGSIYIVGGVTTAGVSDLIYRVDPATGSVRVAGHLRAPVAHAPLVALGGVLYLVGGSDAAGHPLAAVLKIDPASGAVARAATLPVALADAAAVAVAGAGEVIVIGGMGRRASDAIYALRP